MGKDEMLLLRPDTMTEGDFVDLVMRIQALNDIDSQRGYDDKYTIAARISKLSCCSINPVGDIKYIVQRAKELATLAMRREFEQIEKNAAQVVLLSEKK